MPVTHVTNTVSHCTVNTDNDNNQQHRCSLNIVHVYKKNLYHSHPNNHSFLQYVHINIKCDLIFQNFKLILLKSFKFMGAKFVDIIARFLQVNLDSLLST